MKKSILLYWILVGELLLNPLSMLCAQSISSEPTILPKEQTVYSPQVNEMIRYDHTSLQLNTGCLDLNIPLIEWNEPDFDFPISLFYDSSGFRPRDSDNYVGRNWMLGIGGVVYRKVNGVPDDMQNYPEPIHPENRINGFMNVLGKRYFDLKQLENNFKNNPYQYSRQRDITTSTEPTLILNGKNSYTESSADIFYFSFGKHSGKFIINYDGTVSAGGNNGGKYEVDLRDMQIIERKENLNTRIHIKTDDGYIYTFGGEGYSSLEYNISCEGRFSAIPSEAFNLAHAITAYHLTKITAPNGRSLTIKYRDTNPEYHTNPSKLRELTSEGYNVKESIRMQYLYSGRSVFQGYRMYPLDVRKNDVFGADQKLYTLTKTALIEFISAGRMQLFFNYSPRSMNPYNEDQESGYFPYNCGAKLDKIEVYASGIDKHVSFAYQYQAGGRLFLDKVTTNDDVYSFQYNVPYIQDPTPMTSNIDHWGFWRGSKKNNGIIPSMEMSVPYASEYQDYMITSDDRDATGEYIDYTLLSQVNYPTGGYTVFKYEPNYYSWGPRYSSGGSYYPAGAGVMGGVALAGGARIYSVAHHDARGKPVKKSIFTYGSGKQHGELTYMPYYKYTRTITTGAYQSKVDGISVDSEGITDLPYPATHIRYPKVTEHFVSPYAQHLSTPHPRKVTTFAQLLTRYCYSYFLDDYTYPTYEEGIWILRPENYFPTSTLQDYNRNLLAHPSLDISLQYGKVESEQFYNTAGTLIKRCDYRYSFHNKDKYALRTYMPILHYGMRTGLYSHLLKEPLFEYLLDEKETVTYPAMNGAFCLKKDVEFFKYDRNGMLTEKKMIKNNGDSLVTSNKYSEYDIFHGFQILPVSTTQSIRNEVGEILLQKDSIDYSVCASTIFEHYYPMKPSKHSIYNTAGKLVSQHYFTNYDSYGHLLSEMGADGKQTVYVWGNYGQYMLARIENTTCEEVESLLGCTLDYFSKYSEDSSTLDTLRHRLPNARIYTYAYKGNRMTRVTAPDGQNTFYTYDAKERLTETFRQDENGRKEILQLNEYHIVNE